MPNWRNVMDLPPQEQVPIYREHLERNPKDAAIWFDLGLAHKMLHDWAECARANRRALDISQKPGDPAWWNLGIAATALRDWATARNAWRGFGIAEIVAGNEPLDLDYGPSPVRLPHGEVVWGKRIDPARVKIANIPFPESGYRWGDIVLHDGEPNGERLSGVTRYHVFDVLERWSPSEIPTIVIETDCGSEEDALTLIEMFESSQFAAEDWTRNVRPLCQACSTGKPGDHDHPFTKDGTFHSFGIACPAGLAATILERWALSSPQARRYKWRNADD